MHETPKSKEDERVLLLKVTMDDHFGRAEEGIYRVIGILEGATLYKLAETIVDSFDFGFDHAFGFYDNVKNWTKSKEGYELFADIGEGSKYKSVKRTKVGKVFDHIGKKMLFLFDYGDDWRFIVKLQAVEEQKVNQKYPVLVEARGEAPPQYYDYEEEGEEEEEE